MAQPISIEAAFAILLREAGESERVEAALAFALGHALAEPVCADRDLPPFDQARMDGFAVRSADVQTPPAELRVIEHVPAGRAPTKSVGPGEAIRIMTGAPVPAGADAVVMLEQTEPLPAGAAGTADRGQERVRVGRSLRAESNIARRGSDVKQGQEVLPVGARIGPAEVGVLAAIGITDVPVRRKPRLAILGTGDELVDPGVTPKSAQIRNSNSYQLLAQAAAHGLEALYLGIAPDDPAATRRLIERGLDEDVLITTGGISAGDHDYVGSAFKALNVELFFTAIHVKPGKPTTFGKRGQTLVFGLPGNPVAALVCFHLFVMTALRQRMGFADPLPRKLRLALCGNAPRAGDRPTFRPAQLVAEEGATTRVKALEWHGSGDLAACAGADGFMLQAPGAALADGQAVDFYPLPAVL